MNKTIISIEIQDKGSKDAEIIVIGERNQKILFQEKFVFNSEDYPLRLHILSDEYHQRYPQLGTSLGLLCIRKLLDDIEKRSVMNETPDYRVIDK